MKYLLVAVALSSALLGAKWECKYVANNLSSFEGASQMMKVYAKSAEDAKKKASEKIKKERGADTEIYSLDCAKKSSY
jgi:hypothetical protein